VRVRVDLVSGAAAGPGETEPGWPRDARRIAAVVIDVLRATTTLTVALANGAARVVPVAGIEPAFAWKARDPGVLLCGERDGFKVPGFDLGNSPAEYGQAAVAGRTLVFASTNGSRAMLACAGCGVRLLGAFVNASAVVAALEGRAFVRLACAGRTTLPERGLVEFAPHDTRKQLERLAPETLLLPSGRHVRLDYGDDGTVHAQAKLQELFGMAETPRIGPRREPVTFSLLAPNGRPVQTTQDLRGFWDRTYPEVRKELRGRYPKHPWPDDPWSATPTASAKRR